MFLLRLLSIWALMLAVASAPQGLNSRFERKVFQLNETTSTSNESVAANQEQNTNQQPKFLRLTLLQDLQPPTFGILNKLPYLTLQPPLFALPQQLTDDFLAPLPGPASNSVELEKRSGSYAQENNSSELEENSIGSNDILLETTVSLNNNNNAVLVQTETIKNEETSNSDSTASLDLSSETPTTEINDLTSAVIASVNTKIINKIQTTFNDETTNDSSNLILSTESERDDVKTTSTPELEYSTSNDVSTQQITSATQTINNLNVEQLSSTLEYSSDNPTTVSDQNIERLTEIAINSRLGFSEGKETLAEELTTTSNEGLEVKSTAEDLVSDTPTTNGEGLPETTSSATTLQTELPKSDDLINESNTEPTEVANINSRYGIYETTTTNELETKSSDSLDIAPTEEVLTSTLTELDNSRYTTAEVEEITSAANVETEDASKFTTTEIQEVSTSQSRLSNRCGIASTNSDGSTETATTSKYNCEDDFVTEDVVFDEPSDSTEEVSKVSKKDLQLSNRVSETEEVTQGRENEQLNEITVAPNLESSAENPTTTEVLVSDRSDEEVAETTTKENELSEIVASLFGESKQNETTEEELVLLTTTTSSEEVSTKRIVEGTTTLSEEVSTKRIVEADIASQSDGITSTTEEASTKEPLTQQDLQSRINTVEEVTVTNEKISEELLPPFENIKSNLSVSYGLNYNPNSNDFTYTISTTVKSVLTHKSGEEGNVTSEVNASAPSQDQDNLPAFSTSVIGSVSSISQGPETASTGFGIEVNKTNNAPEISVRFLPPLASEPKGIHGRISEPKLSATFTPNLFDINKGSHGLGQNTFTVPSNTPFTIKLEKSGTNSNFSAQFHNVSETSAHVGAEPSFRQNGFQDSGSLTGNLDRRTGDTQTDFVSFISPSSSPEVGRTINFPTNEAQFGININRNNGPPNLSVQFSNVPNVNDFGRKNVAPGSSFESRFNSGNVRGRFSPNSGARARTGFDIKEKVNFNSVINIGNNSPKTGKVNDAETKPSQAVGSSLDKPSKFRSVTIDTSEANNPSELLKSYNKNGLNTSSPDKYVEAKYVGQTYVSSNSKPGTSTVDEKTKNESFKRQYGFDLSFLNRGINSKPRSTNLGFSNRETPPEPPKTEAPQSHFNKPFKPRTFRGDGGSSRKSNTFGVSLGPYRDTLIHHTGKGWSLMTYDKLILHTGLSGQYL